VHLLMLCLLFFLYELIIIIVYFCFCFINKREIIYLLVCFYILLTLNMHSEVYSINVLCALN
jgi:hypothetical protein